MFEHNQEIITGVEEVKIKYDQRYGEILELKFVNKRKLQDQFQADLIPNYRSTSKSVALHSKVQLHFHNVGQLSKQCLEPKKHISINVNST